MKDEVLDHFSLSEIGNVCKLPVNSIRECKKAVNFLPKAVYVRATGMGHDLPYGCIAHNTISQQIVIYWNPNGVTVSNDTNVRQVCNDKIDLYEGTYTLKLEINIYISDIKLTSNVLTCILFPLWSLKVCNV